ncbi:hypothetical protein ACB092_09G062800 [Castanea dentata]
MAEWSKAPDSSSGLRERAWVQIPLLTICFIILHILFDVSLKTTDLLHFGSPFYPYYCF